MKPLWLTDAGGTASHAAEWAGQRVLSGYDIPGSRPLDRSLRAPMPPAFETPCRGFHGPAWLAGATRSLSCNTAEQGYRLEVDQVGTFIVQPHAGMAWIDSADGDHGVIGQILLGPCLPLLLAARGLFQLHASAMLDDHDQAILLMGSSGVGKSTLAAAVPAPWRRIADDIVTVRNDPEDGVWIPGPCPQLKLPCPIVSHAARQVRRIVVLKPGGSLLNIHRLSAVQATLALSRHTVAARLFAPTLLQRHLHWCAEAAGSVEVLEAEYPQEPEMIQPLLRKMLA